MSMTATRERTSPREESSLGDLLAATFEGIARPAWVHDLDSRVVYRNPAAGRSGSGGEVQVFELVDHADRQVGSLVVGTGR